MIKQIVILLALLSTGLLAEPSAVDTALIRTDVKIIYKGIHLTGFAGHGSIIYRNRIGVELGYGYDFLNSYTGSLVYYINTGSNQFSVYAGYGLFQRKEEKLYSIKIRALHAGAGYESAFWDNLTIGQTISAVKFLDERFTIPDLRIKNTFELMESNYYEISIFIGYRFSLDGVFGR